MIVSANTGLDTYMLKPPGMTGEKLFAHMVSFRELHHNQHSTPSDYLLLEVTEGNKEVIDLTSKVIKGGSMAAKRGILKDSLGCKAKMRLSRRKLDSLGRVKCHSSLLNDDKALAGLESKLQLAQSLAAITEGDERSDAQKVSDEQNKLREAYNAAMEKLDNRGGDLKKLFKPELRSILFVKFDEYVKEKDTISKGNLIRRLREKQDSVENTLPVSI